MEPPADAQIIDTETSIYWFDPDGVMCAISKKTAAPTLESTKKSIEDLKRIIGEEKVCLLIDVTNSGESSREIKEYAAKELPTFIKAIAMISRSELGKMLANLFFNIKKQPYPTKMFTDEFAAKNWLKQYL
jgi:hypothetical protein